MATPRFDNREDLQRWLERQPKPVSLAIAARAAMRAVMIGAPDHDARDAQDRADILSPMLRAAASSWVAVIYPLQGAELYTAAKAAAFAKINPAAFAATAAALAAAANADPAAFGATAAAFVASDNADPAAFAVSAASNAGAYAAFNESIWREVSKDADFIEALTPNENAAVSLCDQRLWWAPDGRMSEAWNAFAEELSDKKRIRDPLTGFERVVAKDPEDRPIDEHWDVWISWIDDRCKGVPTIEALEVERALIPDDDWKKGPRHVNGLIRRMIERHQADALRNKAKQPETITRDPATGLHSVLPDTVADPRRYENALNKVRYSLGALRAAITGDNNMYGDLERIADRLDDALSQYASDSMRMHDEFVKAAKRIIDKVETAAAPKGDELVDDLIDDLSTGHIDIAGSDPAIKALVLPRLEARKRGLSGVEEQDLDLATEAKALVSDASLARQLREDRDVIVALDEHGEHPEDPTPEDAAYRLASRLPRIDETSVDRVVGAADKMAKLNKGGEAGYRWLRFFLDWFG